MGSRQAAIVAGGMAAMPAARVAMAVVNARSGGPPVSRQMTFRR